MADFGDYKNIPLRYYQEIHEKQSFRGELEGRGVVEGVGNFQCRPINPVILFYLMDCSMRLHVSSCTNRAGLKQLVTTVWIKPKASQAHVSRKRKQLTHEGVTRCVTRYMGNRNNRDGKTSLKRQRTPENTTDTQENQILKPKAVNQNYIQQYWTSKNNLKYIQIQQSISRMRHSDSRGTSHMFLVMLWKGVTMLVRVPIYLS